MTTASSPSATSSGARRRPRWGRRFLLGGVALLLLVLLLAALAPMIASRLAPGAIESSVNPTIRGDVKVAAVSVGWFSPAKVGPLTLLDENGQQVGQANVRTELSLWKAITGGLLGGDRADLGRITIDGSAQIVQYADGATNLARAIEPDPGAPKPGSSRPIRSSSSAGQAITATLVLDGVSVTQRDASLKSGPSSETGVRDLRGEIALSADTRSGLNATAKGKLTGEPVGPGTGQATGPAPGKVTLDVDALIEQKPAGAGQSAIVSLERAKVDIRAQGAPVALVDALANLGGALSASAEPTAALTLQADGTLRKLDGLVDVDAGTMRINLPVRIADGYLTTVAPSEGTHPGPTLELASTRGLALLPQLRELDKSLSEHVRVSDWPSLAVSLEQLRVPAPVDEQGAPRDLTKTDLRGSGAVLNVDLSAIRGEVFVPGGKAETAPPDANPSGARPGGWRPFTTEPVRFALAVPDLGKGVDVNQSLRATIDAQPAGTMTLRVSATGLLDEQGRLRLLAQQTPPNGSSAGALAALADRFEIDLTLDGVSTPLLTPVVEASGLPIALGTDVGPTLTLRASVRPGDARAATLPTAGGQAHPLAGLPPLRLSLNVESANANASAEMDLTNGRLTSVGQGVRASLNSAAPLARRIVNTPATQDTEPAAADRPLISSGNGRVELLVTQLDADLNKLMARGGNGAGGSVSTAADRPPIPVDAISLDATFTLADLGVQSTSGLSANINTLTLRTLLPARGGDGPKNPIPVVELRSDLTHRGKPFKLEGKHDLYGLARGNLPTGAWPDILLGVRPVGTITLADLPSELVVSATGLDASPAASEPSGEATPPLDSAPLDLAHLISDLLGTGVTATANFSYNDAQQAEFIRAQVSSSTQSLTAETFMQIRRDSVTVPTFNAQVRADAQTVNRVLAPDGAGPTLAGSAGAKLSIAEPVTLPLTRSAPSNGSGETVSIDLGRLSAVVANIVIDPEPVLSNIAAPGGQRDQPVSVRLTQATGHVELPQGALAKPADGSSAVGSPPAKVSVNARALRGQDGAPVAVVNADVRYALDGTSTDVTATIDQIATATLDDVLALDGLLQGLAGDSAKVSLTTKLGDAAGQSAGRITASIDAPRIKGADITLVRDAQRYALASPATITLTPDAQFLNTMLIRRQQAAMTASSGSQPDAGQSGGTRPGSNPLEQIGGVLGNIGSSGKSAANVAGRPTPPQTQDQLRLVALEPVTLRLNRLAVAAPSETVGLFKPGVFDTDASFETREIVIEVVPVAPDGSIAGQPVRTSFNTLRGSAKLNPQGALALETTFDQVGGSGGTNGTASSPSKLAATVSRFADQAGNPTTGSAVLDADINISGFPTPVVDALANQGGLATELLGPTVSLKGTARQFALASDANGTIDLSATSPRAKAQLKGNIRDGRFVQSGGTAAQLIEIRPQLVQELAGSVPIVETLEKSPTDAPSVVTATGLEVPLDGDLSKLNGKLVVDVGVARFTTKSIFGKLLKAAGGKAEGTIGRRIEPFTVTAKAGVLEYDRFSLPLGEFNLETQGQVDLVNRQIRVTTYAPFFAIAEEATGPISLGIGGKLDLINRNTLVPITTKGSLDNPSTGIDAEAFLKGIGDSLIKNPAEGIGKTLEDIFGGGRKKNDQKK